MKHFKKIIAFVLAVLTLTCAAIPVLAAEVTMNNVNVRKGPGTGYTVAYKLSPGTQLTVRFHAYGSSLNGSKDWYCVTWYDGMYREGYIHGSYLTDRTTVTECPQDSSAAFGPSLLRYGSKGIYVYNMQMALFATGYFNNTIKCDGVYGRDTEEALKSFQRDHVIEDYEGQNVDDGLAGPKTKEALWRNAGEYLKKHGVIIPNG